MGAIYKITDVGNTYSLCFDQTVVINQGRGNVYVRAMNESMVDPYGVWESEFKYTAKWQMNLSNYDLDRVWNGKTMSSLVITPNNFANSTPVTTKTELLSSTISLSTDLYTLATNLENSINGNSFSSGYYVHSWEITNINVQDFETRSINVTSLSPIYASFSLLSLIVESVVPTTIVNQNYVASNFGTGYTFPLYGVIGTSSYASDSGNRFYWLQSGLDSVTASLPCQYDIYTNNIYEVYDTYGNIWRSGADLYSIGFSSIYDYPIMPPPILAGGLYNLSVFFNSVIDSCYLTPYNTINSSIFYCDLKGIWLLPGYSYNNSVLYSCYINNTSNSAYMNSSLLDSSMFSSRNSLFRDSIISRSGLTEISCNSAVISNVYSYNSSKSFSEKQFSNFERQVVRDLIMQDGLEISRIAPDFRNTSYGKTFSLYRSGDSGFYEIGYQTPHTATASTNIGMTINLLKYDVSAFTSSVLFTASINSGLSNINTSTQSTFSIYAGFWEVLMSFDTEMSPDKINFYSGPYQISSSSDISKFNVYIKKL